jgi:hypothetical protein
VAKTGEQRVKPRECRVEKTTGDLQKRLAIWTENLKGQHTDSGGFARLREESIHVCSMSELPGLDGGGWDSGGGGGFVPALPEAVCDDGGDFGGRCPAGGQPPGFWRTEWGC